MSSMKLHRYRYPVVRSTHTIHRQIALACGLYRAFVAHELAQRIDSYRLRSIGVKSDKMGI